MPLILVNDWGDDPIKVAAEARRKAAAAAAAAVGGDGDGGGDETLCKLSEKWSLLFPAKNAFLFRQLDVHHRRRRPPGQHSM